VNVGLEHSKQIDNKARRARKDVSFTRSFALFLAQPQVTWYLAGRKGGGQSHAQDWQGLVAQSRGVCCQCKAANATKSTH
jgi:hypothetical protein